MKLRNKKFPALVFVYFIIGLQIGDFYVVTYIL